jgi:Fe-S-cluster containining protein
MPMLQEHLVTCDACRGDCCTGIAVEIPRPRTRKDYDDVRWYLYHEGMHVYIDRDGDWIAEMDLPCGQRDPGSGRCRIYARRPPVCREAQHAECERNAEDARVRFRTVEEYDRWLRSRRRKRRASALSSRR